ncbi:phosphoglycerate dehydrogenase [Desulfobulbus sp. US1]|nr:phosphoglycerate dehydrogenase [Desulfobulbus sp. US4]MCW5204867.1 phosphoglycerate dehydrogenase [Desulfobulbus sp. N2]MCW5209241.1 phosphoglycerate dehydrogenase [Desulfobulbus sp. US1]MCW5210517.1 phosphoglycerate dehydrogenase [Desulfobulbus sp. N3]MCW5214066.1 phosphoglycerate dehydrogenase [Desulfobulbus sp. US5]WLE97658.1 MAG: phosphoglycerate dehydrogenase [Candidatus Electrothrix communis]
MTTCPIAIMNAVASEGLEIFGDKYQLDADSKEALGLVLRSSPVDLNEFPNLVAIARAGAGVNNIPVDEASERGICVFNTPGANANAVVELLFTMLGISLRNVQHGMAFCEGLQGDDEGKLNAEVEAQKKGFKGMEMSGKTLGVIGLGQIGVRVANMGIHHNMRVIGYDPYPVMDNIHDLLPDVELAKARRDLLAQADFVSVHVPLNKNTKGLVNQEFIDFMKEDALLFNYARGPVVDEDAVLEALESGRIAGHISDFPSPKLINHEKILLTPHLGASTTESEENCACMAVKELKGYLEYGNITHSVNFPNVESIPTVWVHTRLIVINKDAPGMIGLMSNILGQHGINIMSYTNKSNGTMGYNIIDTATAVSPEVCKEIEAVEGVVRTRVIPLKNGSDAD